MSDRIIRVYSGATAIITGGASGIGRAMAEELARRGSEVVLADLQIELAEEVAFGIRASGGKASAYHPDVTDYSAVESLVQETVDRTERLDYMFNNAGIAIGGPVHLLSILDWNRLIDVNLRGVANGVQAAYKIMLHQGFGHIVNTASAAGLLSAAGAGTVAYAATKHAVVGLSTSLRAEASLAGIRVSVLCPGAIRTPILDGGGKYGKFVWDLSQEEQQAYWEKRRAMPSEVFARKALDAIAKNKAIIVIPSWYTLFWRVSRLSPSLGIFLIELDIKKQANMADDKQS